MRPGVKGTGTSAAFSTAAHPPSTMRSASDTFFPPVWEALNFFCTPSNALSTSLSCAGLFTFQFFWGARRMRAPLAPPRLSLPRKVEADAQAVDTNLRSEEHTSELQSR